MPKVNTKPKKKAATKAKKVKGKVSVRRSVKLRSKGAKTANADTIMPTPTPRSNGATFKVKIRRK